MSVIISEHGVSVKDEAEFDAKMEARGWRVVETGGTGRVILTGKTSQAFQRKATHHMAQVEHKVNTRRALRAKLEARRQVVKVEAPDASPLSRTDE